MHEEVHDRAGKQQQIGQCPEEVRLVRGPQVEKGNRGEDTPGNLCAARHRWRMLVFGAHGFPFLAGAGSGPIWLECQQALA